MMLNVESLPEMTSYDNYEQSGKLDRAILTVIDLWKYKLLIEMCLSNIEVPAETIVCGKVACKNPKHICDPCVMYVEILDRLNNASRLFSQKRVQNDHFRAGWNEYVSKLHLEA